MPFKQMFLVSPEEFKRKKREENEGAKNGGGSSSGGGSGRRSSGSSKEALFARSGPQINQTDVVSHGGKVNFYQNAHLCPPSPFHRIFFAQGRRQLPASVGKKEEKKKGQNPKKKKKPGKGKESSTFPFSPFHADSAQPSAPLLAAAPAFPSSSSRGEKQRSPAPRLPFAAAAPAAPPPVNVKVQMPSFAPPFFGSENVAAPRAVAGVADVRADIDEMKEAVEAMALVVRSLRPRLQEVEASLLQRLVDAHQDLFNNIDICIEESLVKHERQSRDRSAESVEEIIGRAKQLLKEEIVEVRTLLTAQETLLKEQHGAVLDMLQNGPVNRGVDDIFARLNQVRDGLSGKLEELFNSVSQYQQGHISGELKNILTAVRALGPGDGSTLLTSIQSMLNGLQAQLQGDLMGVQERLSRRMSQHAGRGGAAEKLLRDMIRRMEANQANFLAREARRVTARSNHIVSNIQNAVASAAPPALQTVVPPAALQPPPMGLGQAPLQLSTAPPAPALAQPPPPPMLHQHTFHPPSPRVDMPNITPNQTTAQGEPISAHTVMTTPSHAAAASVSASAADAASASAAPPSPMPGPSGRASAAPSSPPPRMSKRVRSRSPRRRSSSADFRPGFSSTPRSTRHDGGVSKRMAAEFDFEGGQNWPDDMHTDEEIELVEAVNEAREGYNLRQRSDSRRRQEREWNQAAMGGSTKGGKRWTKKSKGGGKSGRGKGKGKRQ